MSTWPNRTPAERRCDILAAEARRLRSVATMHGLSKEQHTRLREIEADKLPAAWRAVNQMREGVR